MYHNTIKKKNQRSNMGESIAQSFQFAEQIVCDHYFESEESDEDETEYAYQCDFQKRQPQKPCNPSLLTDMLTHMQQTSGGTLSKAVTISDSKKPDLIDDPLSESLKRNLEWQKTQDIMSKYDETIVKKSHTEDTAYTDEFSRW